MNVREAAFHSLIAVCKDGAYSNIVVSKIIQKEKFTDRDRRFYTELVYGTLRSLNYVDYIIGILSSRKKNSLDPVCLAVLRMGLYQLFFMDKVPPSAACNEAVKLARRFGNEGMAKFVNALLRNSLRQKERLAIPTFDENPVLHLSLTWHQQSWLIEKWITEFGRDHTVILCRYFDTIPELCIRANTERIDREGLMQLLSEKGIPCRPAEHAPDGIYAEKNPGIHKLTEIADGLGLIQDEPSQLVAAIADPQEKTVIFDVCAAPGGKTTHLATLGTKSSTVYAFDIYEHKLKLIEDNVNRLGLKNVRTRLQDGTSVGEIYPEKADCVLVDAPCSGLGILRHKPDLRWRKTVEDLTVFPPLQKKILESAAKCVKPGGTLVYSTCTMNRAENEDIVNAFRISHKDFEVVPVGNAFGFSKDSDYLSILPQDDGLDGFFIAKLRRK